MQAKGRNAHHHTYTSTPSPVNESSRRSREKWRKDRKFILQSAHKFSTEDSHEFPHDYFFTNHSLQSTCTKQCIHLENKSRSNTQKSLQLFFTLFSITSRKNSRTEDILWNRERKLVLAKSTTAENPENQTNNRRARLSEH